MDNIPTNSPEATDPREQRLVPPGPQVDAQKINPHWWCFAHADEVCPEASFHRAQQCDFYVIGDPPVATDIPGHSWWTFAFDEAKKLRVTLIVTPRTRAQIAHAFSTDTPNAAQKTVRQWIKGFAQVVVTEGDSVRASIFDRQEEDFAPAIGKPTGSWLEHVALNAKPTTPLAYQEQEQGRWAVTPPDREQSLEAPEAQPAYLTVVRKGESIPVPADRYALRISVEGRSRHDVIALTNAASIRELGNEIFTRRKQTFWGARLYWQLRDALGIAGDDGGTRLKVSADFGPTPWGQDGTDIRTATLHSDEYRWDGTDLQPLKRTCAVDPDDDTLPNDGTEPYIDPVTAREWARSYWTERGIPEAVIEEDGRVQFHLTDADLKAWAEEHGKKMPGKGDKPLTPAITCDTGDDYYQIRSYFPSKNEQGKTMKWRGPAGVETALWVGPRAQALLEASSFGEDLSAFTDPSGRVGIVLTEGYAKMLALEAAGYAAIAAGGVANFFKGRSDEQKARKAVKVPQHELTQIDLERITITLCFDSDCATNPAVKAALAEVRQWATEQGATVDVIMLPDGADGAKHGADDAIALHGPGIIEECRRDGFPGESELRERFELPLTDVGIKDRFLMEHGADWLHRGTKDTGQLMRWDEDQYAWAISSRAGLKAALLEYCETSLMEEVEAITAPKIAHGEKGKDGTTSAPMQITVTQLRAEARREREKYHSDRALNGVVGVVTSAIPGTEQTAWDRADALHTGDGKWTCTRQKDGTYDVKFHPRVHGERPLRTAVASAKYVEGHTHPYLEAVANHVGKPVFKAYLGAVALGATGNAPRFIGVLHGEAGGAKSTIAMMVRKAFGPMAVTAPFETMRAYRQTSGHDAQRAKLAFKHAVIVSEGFKECVIDDAFCKALTAGDEIEGISGKGTDIIDGWDGLAALLFISNHQMRFGDPEGINDRLAVSKVPPLPKEARNPDILRAARQADPSLMDAVMTMAIEALHEAAANGGWPVVPTEMKFDAAEMLKADDPLRDCMAQLLEPLDAPEKGSPLEATLSELYDAIQAWERKTGRKTGVRALNQLPDALKKEYPALEVSDRERRQRKAYNVTRGRFVSGVHYLVASGLKNASTTLTDEHQKKVDGPV